MSINDSYNEEAIVEAIAVALDNFYTNLIKKVDSLNIKAVMKRKNPYLLYLLPRKRFLVMCFLNLLPQQQLRVKKH